MISIINQQFIKAAQNNQLDELKNLLSQGADIHAGDDMALKGAVLDGGQLETVKFLIEQGANVGANNDEALRSSALNGHLETVKFLVLPDLGSVAITQGADIHANSDEALRYSAQSGHLEIVKFLIAQGANIHARDDDILKTATRDKNEPILMLLNAFLTEEKLLVAALGSMPLVADPDSIRVILPLGAAQTQRLSITKTQRTKI